MDGGGGGGGGGGGRREGGMVGEKKGRTGRKVGGEEWMRRSKGWRSEREE